MNSGRLTHRIAIVAGGAALVAVGVLTGCSPTTEKEAPSSTSTPAPSASTSAPAATPTEKAIGPGGENSFSPTVDPTPPGAVCKSVVGGVCVR
jgi:hypothetical protein